MPGLRGRLGGREGLGGAEVVELADRRVAGGEHLAVDVGVAASRTESGRRAVGLLEHPVAPRPEVGSGGAAAQRPLERVAVAVDEPGQRDACRSRRDDATTQPRLRLAEPMEAGSRDQHRLRARAADPERADAAALRGDPALRLAAARRARAGRAGAAGSSSASPRSPTSSTATSPAAGTSSRSSARSPTRSPTG